MVPADVTRALVAEELVGVRAWAGRHEATIEWTPECLELHVTLPRTDPQDRFYLLGDLGGYRVVPPAWTFTGPDWTEGVATAYPSGQGTPFGSSLFIKSDHGPVICAPFNRLAYATEHGPHRDWGGPAQWLGVAGQVRATTIGEMIAVIYRDIRATTGRLS